MADTYTLPPVEGTVTNLVPESAGGTQLKPDTTVLCIHRGRHVLVDKFDGIDYRIDPGLFYAPYGAARHFQRRAVIPGTRNPEINTEQSYIGIKGLDPDDMCEPLTDEEVALFGAAVEAIDRGSFSDPADRNTRTIRSGVAGRAPHPGGRRPDIKTSREDVMDKPGVTDAGVASAEAAGERGEQPRKGRR
jgi:hypothetical protein